MTNKIVIAKPGFNVLTETDPDNLVFSSDYDTLKYYLSGSVTLDYPVSGTVETTVTHNLGYIPFFIAYVDKFAGEDRYSMTPGIFSDFIWLPPTELQHLVEVYADATKLYFQILTMNQTAGTHIFQYKIFRNRLGI